MADQRKRSPTEPSDRIEEGLKGAVAAGPLPHVELVIMKVALSTRLFVTP